MKQNTPSLIQDQRPASEPQATPASNSTPSRAETNFVPSPDEVSRRAYFSYVNQGSLPGHEVQHWLEAEKQLVEERKQTQVHSRRH